MVLAIATYQWYLASTSSPPVLWVGGGRRSSSHRVARQRQSDPAKEVDSRPNSRGRSAGRSTGCLPSCCSAFGFALVEKGNWGWDEGFVFCGLAAWLFSIVIGIFYYSREIKGLTAAYVRGPEDIEVRMLG